MSLLKVSTAYFSLIKNAKSKKFSTVCYNNAMKQIKKQYIEVVVKYKSSSSSCIMSCRKVSVFPCVKKYDKYV